jgi:hypothetical protein
MQDTCKIHRIRILITNVPKFDNKVPSPEHPRHLPRGARRLPGDQLGLSLRTSTDAVSAGGMTDSLNAP